MSQANQRHGAYRADRHSDESFGDLVYQQLRNAPWVLCSVGVHAVMGLLLFVYPWEHGQGDDPNTVIAMVPRDSAEEFDEEQPPDVVETPPIEESDKVFEDPELEDAKLDEKNETDDDEPHEETLGDPNNTSTHELDWHSTNATIGIGASAAGKFGTGRGGSKNLTVRGGGTRTESAIDLALEWLKIHQSSDGRWKCDRFSDQCKLNKCDGAGEAAYTPGVSGLALLAFLGYGETHQAGTYKDTVRRRGLKYLKSIQDSEGCFGPRTSQHFQYNHSIASLAMTEAYGMTNSRLFKDAAQRGVNFVHQSQNPYLAWRYGVRDGDNDTSVTGWMTMALKSAKMAELEVDSTAFKGAVAWVDKMTEPEFGRVGYQQRGGQPARTTEKMDRFPADQSESLTAVGVLTRVFAGQDPKTPAIQQGADLMVKKLPKWDEDAGTIDMYYWYYGTLAMFQVGGNHWKQWNQRLKTDMVDNQRVEAARDERGSWDPVGPWAPEGGRVYSTAVMAMCMEVYYRYDQVFGAK